MCDGIFLRAHQGSGKGLWERLGVVLVRSVVGVLLGFGWGERFVWKGVLACCCGDLHLCMSVFVLLGEGLHSSCGLEVDSLDMYPPPVLCATTQGICVLCV